MQIKQRTLDEWYVIINSIYLDRNFYREPASIFMHLVEVVGALSLLGSEKKKSGIVPDSFLAKGLAWWMALNGKLGVRSVEDMIWSKFPFVCPYCRKQPHDDPLCQRMKASARGPNWDELEQISKSNETKRPRTLSEWRNMFASIYPVVGTEGLHVTIERFVEELGELAEAIRVFPIAPSYYLSEAADVFAWLVHLHLLIESRADLKMKDEKADLAGQLYSLYPDQCNDCHSEVCNCPPILPGTLGRIANEVRADMSSFAPGGALLPTSDAVKLFDPGAKKITVGSQTITVDSNAIVEIYKLIRSLHKMSVEHNLVTGDIGRSLDTALRGIEDLLGSHRLTQESIDLLLEVVSNMPSEKRNIFMGFLTNIASAPWAVILLEAIRQIVKKIS